MAQNEEKLEKDKVEETESNEQEEETKMQYTANDFPKLTEQFLAEYELAWKNQEPKKEEARRRFKLYNNQKRDKKAVGDTTLFTVVQTVLAYLYDDRLTPGFGGREEGDDEQAANLDAMAEFDYDEMEKDKLDYDWWFDAIFFGYGLVLMEEYVRDPENNQFYPLPENIDPSVFLRDPDATSINGRKHSKKGAARFFGFPVKMSKFEMENSPHIFKQLDYTKLSYQAKDATKDLMQQTADARDEAQGRAATDQQKKEEKLGANARYDIQVWYTFYEKDGEPKRIKAWFANGGATLIGVQFLEEDYWKLVYRPLFPTAHDFDGVSVPDLIEDKQRARAVIANLGLNALRADVMPSYVYDSNKITNRKDLKLGFNKMIPIDAKGERIDTAILPLQKARFNMQLIDFIYNALDASAQKATATPDIQQGIQSEKDRPLGETNLVKTGADTRSSLSSKVGGWSEKEFWQLWYMAYFTYFADEIDTKVLRLVGAFGEKWRPLDKKDFITRINPDIKIESKAVNRAQQIEERQSLIQFYSLALQEPTANRRYGLKKLAKLFGQKKDEIDRLFPKTIDERIAEQENEMLNENKFVGVESWHDHNVHLEILAKAKDTPATRAHQKTHEKALMIKKTNPEFFPADEAATEFQAPGGEQLPGAAQARPQATVQPSQTSGVRQ